MKVSQQLHFRRPEGHHVEIMSPANSASEGLELALVRGAYAGASPGRETLLVILSGRCEVEVGGQGPFLDLGRREDVFGGPATAVYVPAAVPYRIQGTAEVAILRAPAPPGGEAYVIQPEEVEVAVRGSGSFRREVHTLLAPPRAAASLVVGETFNEPGGWSSYPPHKHDVNDPPREARLQEVYHFRLQPSHGFGLQRVYSPRADLDLTFTVEDGDTVLIPHGYHPVVAGAGYRLYYLWALAGEGRILQMQEDPAHSWVSRAAPRI
jgi:5-deoxy-glucuronate isomerase